MTTILNDLELASAPAHPSVEQVLRLQSAQGYPAVSLLLSTTPSGRMPSLEADRLRALERSAEQRLQDEELDPVVASNLITELRRLVERAIAAPTDRATAVFAGPGTSALLSLPVSVHDRAVIDPSFATRDLVRALHRTPRHVVLLLSSKDARLLDGVGGALRPAPGRAFPVTRTEIERRNPSKDSLATADLEAFLREVDRGLAAYLRVHPAPVVLVGPEKVLAAYQRVGKIGRIAGSVTGSLPNASMADLAERTRPVIEDYLRSRESEAVALLDRRTGEQRVASGMAAVWLAARRERVEMLAVEEDFFFPARLSEDGEQLVRARDVEHPDVLDDAVDELIELVLERGGWVALVENGALAQHDQVALTLRGRH